MKSTHFSSLKMMVDLGVERFINSLNRLEASHYPSKVAGDFILELRTLACEQLNQIADIANDFPADPTGSFQRLQSEHRKLLNLLDNLYAIENARTDDVPWSLIPSIERMAKAILPGRAILTTSVSAFNYQISWWPGPPNGLRKFLTLSLPKIHRANAFLHLLIGHELFHPLLEPFFASQHAIVLPKIRQGCIDIYRGSGLPNDLHKSQRLDQLVKLASDAWQRSLEEVMCDLGAVAIFGPAAVLSLQAFALTENLDSPPSREGDFYPPMRFRLRSVMKLAIDSVEYQSFLSQLRRELDEENLSTGYDCLTAELEEIRQLVANQSDITAINGEDEIKLAYEFVKSSLPDAWKYVQNIASQVDERWTSYIQQIPCLLRSLSQLIPPGEYRKPGVRLGMPAAFTAIANAAWIHEIQFNRNTDAASMVDSFKRTCRLMLKAIEDSELKQRFPGGAK